MIAASAAAAVLVTGCSSSGSDDGPDPDRTRAAPTGGAPTGGAPAGERRADGAELLYRAEGKRSAQNPAFAPDGGSMLMTEFAEGYNKGAAALGVLPLEGDRTLKKVLEDPDKAAVNLPGTSWNAAAGAFTFATDRDSGHDEVWTMKPGGSPERVTTHDDNSGFNEPSFSPDGEWIVFQQSWEPEHASVQGDSAEQDSIWKIRKSGGAPVRLVDGKGTKTDNRQPNWSPKGDRIVFQRRTSGSESWALWTVDADGTGLRKVTDSPGEHTDPTWSPDGRFLVFSSNLGNLENAQIFVVPADGGQPVRVTRNDGSYDGAPSWSPDGQWIAFESSPGSESNPASLWRIAAPKL